jgi:hypothetical protein
MGYDASPTLRSIGNALLWAKVTNRENGGWRFSRSRFGRRSVLTSRRSPSLRSLIVRAQAQLLEDACHVMVHRALAEHEL